MKRIFILFSIVYGQVTGLVLSISFLLYWLGTPQGEEFCFNYGMGMSLIGCRASTALVLTVAFAVSTVVSLWALRKNKAQSDRE